MLPVSDTKGLGLFDVMEYFVTFGQIIMLQPFLERNDDKADKELIRIRIFYEDQETIDKILKIQRHVIVSRPTRVVKSRPPKDRPEQRFIPKEEIQTAVIKVSKEEVSIFVYFLSLFWKHNLETLRLNAEKCLVLLRSIITKLLRQFLFLFPQLKT